MTDFDAAEGDRVSVAPDPEVEGLVAWQSDGDVRVLAETSGSFGLFQVAGTTGSGRLPVTYRSQPAISTMGSHACIAPKCLKILRVSVRYKCYSPPVPVL